MKNEVPEINSGCQKEKITMDNIPEKETSLEPRRGVAPFATGIKTQGGEWYDPSYNTSISYKEFSLGDVGKFHMFLMRPSQEHIESEANENDQAFTIDLAGTIRTVRLREFYKDGYYLVYLFEVGGTPEQEIDNDQPPQDPRFNLWIDNTKTTLHNGSITIDEDGRNISFLRDLKGKLVDDDFVLPNDPAILQALRINVSSE